MSATTPLFDLLLGSPSTMRGYRCNQFVRDSAPLVAARFSTGASGETDLDLLKSTSLVSLEGGMFQRDFDDAQKVARGMGIFNKYDKTLYPTPPRSSITALTDGYYPQAKVETQDLSFIAYGSFSAGTYFNKLYKITPAGGKVAVTLPAGLVSNAGASITGMTIHKKYLFVSQADAAGAANCFRYDIAADTWQDITGLLAKVFTLRHQLYGISMDSIIYSITNETAAGAATITAMLQVGMGDVAHAPSDALEFNGAAYITKPDGIWRFDGVAVVKVLNLVTQQLCVFNGAMYFFAGYWLYKFDGGTVTRLQYLGPLESPVPYFSPTPMLSLSSNSDYLFISTIAFPTSYTYDDKVSGVASGLRRIYTYDGIGFLLLTEQDITAGASYRPALVWNGTKLYDVFGNLGGGGWDLDYWTFDFANIFTTTIVTTNSKCEFTTSEDDDGFPNVFKSLELIQPLYAGLISGDQIVVSYQYYNGLSWSAWQTLSTITSTSQNYLEITDDTKKLFKRLKINVTLTPTTNSPATLKGVSWRYTLQPRMRWRWNIGLLAFGAQGDQRLRDGTTTTEDANAITNWITQSVKQKTPSFMFSPDHGLVKTQINSAATSFIVKGQFPMYTDPYLEYPLIAVKNNSSVWEIFRVATVSYNAGMDETTITVVERGYLGITAAQINANAEVHICYKVYVTRLHRESTILSEPEISEQPTTGESQIQRQYLVEVTEI